LSNPGIFIRQRCAGNLWSDLILLSDWCFPVPD